MRAICGLIAGIITGFMITPHTEQSSAIGTTVLIAIIFYLISYTLAKRIAQNIPKTEKRKLATNGIFPFIFLLMMFMIIIYTGLHQFMAR
jgi:protein-S-isoprenylcysteine O-methyltransferase Ste14